jgi:hypothetical protein
MNGTNVKDVVKDWAPLFWLAGSLIVVLGFGLVTPKARLDDIEQRLSGVKLVVDQGVDDRRDLRQMLEALVRGECLDRTPQQIALMGLPCRDVGVIRPQPR